MEYYRVQITDTALADMNEIESYIAEQLLNPISAEGQYDRIANEILTLETMPARFGIPPFEPCEELQLHRMMVDGYSVFYLIEGKKVIVTDVLYSASDLERHLSDRH